MATSIARKLKINEGDLLRTFHPPAGFKKSLGELPQGVKISESGNGYQQIHWFVTSKAQLEEELNEVMKMIKPGVTCWIYYPKGSSGVQTDLTRDKGWEELLK